MDDTESTSHNMILENLNLPEILNLNYSYSSGYVVISHKN